MTETLRMLPKEKSVVIDFDGLERGLATGNIEFETLLGSDPDIPDYLYYFRNGQLPRLTSSIVTHIRQLPRNKIRKSHPRLANTVSEIEKSGSFFGWVEEKFGTVYNWLPAVRPWDIKLPVLDTKMGEEEYQKKLIKNMAVIRDWYGPPNMIDHSDPPAIDFQGPHVGFNQHTQSNPDINQDLLEESIALRIKLAGAGFALPGELMGIYTIKLESTKGIPEKVRVMAALLGKPLDGLTLDEEGNAPNLAKQLIRKFGIDPRNPVLSEFGFHLEPQNFNIVLSNNPLDILYSSTDKPWHSCYCQDTNHVHNSNGQQYRFQKGPYGDISAGSAIAYLLDAKGQFVGRSLLRLGFDDIEKEQTGMLKVGVGIEKFYGDVYFKRIMTKSVASIMESVGIPTQKSSQITTPPISNLIYPDNGRDLVNANRYNPNHPYRILRYDGND